MKRAEKIAKKRTTRACKTLRAKPEPEASDAASRAKHLHNVLLFIAEAHGEHFDVTALADGMTDILSRVDWHAMPIKALVEVVSKVAGHVSDRELREMSAEADEQRETMWSTIRECRRDEAGIPCTPDELAGAEVRP